MAIVKTITDEYYFWYWIKEAKKNDSSYGNSFTLEAAKALQAYIEEMSEETGVNVEFDPVAWCVEFSEYDDFEGFQNDTGYTDKDGRHPGYPDITSLDELRDHTQVIECDNGHIIVQDF